ncbi:hypothetical protein HDU67_005948 [Dinochytrium kinnereticum]|nr:hypothetical protein HDU67_005948 [Dinochytrium kinnereticum]
MSEYCDECDRYFANARALQQHIESSSNHFYCLPCGRESFGSPRALQQHLASDRHSPKTIKCPLCSEQRFARISAVAAHIESGQCRFGRRLNISIVASAIRGWERSMGSSNTFTTKLITDGSMDYSGYNNQALEQFYDAYHCVYECPACNRDFRNVTELREHLRSRAHATSHYQCPTCKRQYPSLSALLKHFEQTACGTSKNPLIGKLGSTLKSIAF